MQTAKEHVRVRPRCAQCGSADVVLEGPATWDKSAQIWRTIQPRLSEAQGTRWPQGGRARFVCRDCCETVGVKLAKH